jgi:hypothetical protein
MAADMERRLCPWQLLCVSSVVGSMPPRDVQGRTSYPSGMRRLQPGCRQLCARLAHMLPARRPASCGTTHCGVPARQGVACSSTRSLFDPVCAAVPRGCLMLQLLWTLCLVNLASLCSSGDRL